MEVTKNGDIINWTLNVVNNGGSANTNVKVQFTLPAGLAYQSWTAQKGTFNMSTGLWTIGGMANGTSYKITVKFKVTDITLAIVESGLTGFLLAAAITGDLTDPNDLDNNPTEFVELTSCPPSAGAVNDLNACLCGDVSLNDTPCTHGTTEYRITLGSLVNLDPTFVLDVETGQYNAMGKILDPFAEASFTYSIWCIVDGEELQTSGPATVTIPALFPETFTDKLEILDGDDLGYAKHTALDGTEVTFKLGWVTVEEDSGTGNLIFTYPNGSTVVINLGSVTNPGSTIYPTTITANIVLSNLTMRNFHKVDDSGGANINIVLPDPTTFGFSANRTLVWTFKRINDHDGGSITLTPDNLKTIDGDASYVFAAADKTAVSVWTDGTNYWLA